MSTPSVPTRLVRLSQPYKEHPQLAVVELPRAEARNLIHKGLAVLADPPSTDSPPPGGESSEGAASEAAPSTSPRKGK